MAFTRVLVGLWLGLILSSAWSMPPGWRASPQIDADGFLRGQYAVLDYSDLAPYEEGDDEPADHAGAAAEPPRDAAAAAPATAPNARGAVTGRAPSAARRAESPGVAPPANAAPPA